MLIDPTGAPLRAPAPPAAPRPPVDLTAVDPIATPAEFAPAMSLEEQQRAMDDIIVVRTIIRNLNTSLVNAHAQKLENVTLPIVDVGAMAHVVQSALDLFIDRRSIDENGMRVGMPDSTAAYLEDRVAAMIDRLANTVRERMAKEKKIAVVNPGALSTLPKDAQSVLRGPKG